MNKIVPPVGWTPSSEVENSLSAEDLEKLRSLVSSSSSFEDLEDILASPTKSNPRERPVGKPPQKSKLPTKPPRSKPKSASRQQTRSDQRAVPSPQKPVVTEAVLPTGEWTTPESRERRKWLVIGGSTLGTVVVLAILLVVFVINRPKQLSEKTGPNVDQKSVEPVNHPDGPGSADEPATAVENKLPDKTLAENTAPKVETEPPNSTTEEPNSGTKPNDSETGPTTTDPPGIPGIEQPALPTNPLSTDPVEPETVERPDDLISRDVFGNPIEDDSKLGGLSALLNQSNTSIREFRDLAKSVRDEETLGIAKYYIARPDAVEIPKRGLDLSCGGIIYDKIGLLAMLRDITAITGVPFTFDAARLRADDFDFRVLTNVEIKPSQSKPTNFATAVDAALEPLQLERTATSQGCIVLGREDSAKKITAKYAIPKFSAGPELAQEMVKFIERMIAPPSWKDKNEPPTIELVGDRLSVNQTPIVQRQIKDFLHKLVSIEGGRQQVLRSRWASVQELLQKPAGLSRTLSLPLESLLSAIQRNSGLTILVDWPSVIEEGWTPATMVPGDINETNVYRTVKEIARAMNLTIRAIDANTIELTTFGTAASQSELEVYYYGDIVEKALTEEQVFEVVNQTLSRELTSNPNVRMDFIPQLKCIVAVAPQSLQRQLEVVMNRLRKL